MQCTSCHNKSALVSSPADAPAVTLRLTTTITCTLGHVTRVPVSRAANTGIFRPNKYLRWSFLITPDLGHTRPHVSRVHSLAALLRPSLP